MESIPQLLIEPRNPFAFDPTEFAELVDDFREELSPEYDVRVAYREQAGAAVTLYEVVDFWLSWQGWAAAAQGALLAKLLDKTMEWHRKRREADPTSSSRPIWIRVIVDGGEAKVVGEARVQEPGGEAEYGPFSDDEESRRGLRRSPPPIRPWPPSQEDRPRRASLELANRRIMLEGVHAAVREAQRQGREFAVFDSAAVAGIGATMRLNAAESKGLFRRLIREGYVRLRSSLQDDAGSGNLHAEVEYLTDRGLREIGEL